jgi:hypothetical protein
LGRAHRYGHLAHVAGAEVPVGVVQPDPDGFARYGDTNDHVEIVVSVDIRDPDCHGVVNGLERDSAGRPAGEQEFEAVRVGARTPADVIRDCDIGVSVFVEITDGGGPAERLGRITQPECRAIQLARNSANEVRAKSSAG